MSKTQKQIIGNLGEGVTCNFLKNKGFEIVDRNYWKKWGEIDVVSRKNGNIHFVEVKTVSRENLDREENNVSRETDDEYRPEDNLHPWKLKRMSRVIQSYLLEKSIDDTEWQFDVCVVYIDIINKLAKVKYIEDIIL